MEDRGYEVPTRIQQDTTRNGLGSKACCTFLVVFALFTTIALGALFALLFFSQAQLRREIESHRCNCEGQNETRSSVLAEDCKAQIEELKRNMSRINAELSDHNSTITDILTNLSSIAVQCSSTCDENAAIDFNMTSCDGARFTQVESEKRDNNGGEFEIHIPGVGLTNVYCDVTTDGGNWTVFQKRLDGSEDFYRYWADYVNGFGTPLGEYWLGLEAIHQMTKNGDQELRIDMVHINGSSYYATYSYFKVESASDKYRFRVSGYSGNATDSVIVPRPSGTSVTMKDQPFTTRDQDNDGYFGNCASLNFGGWWYNECNNANLNGRYGITDTRGMSWLNQDTIQRFYLVSSQMKFRRRM